MSLLGHRRGHRPACEVRVVVLQVHDREDGPDRQLQPRVVGSHHGGDQGACLGEERDHARVADRGGEVPGYRGCRCLGVQAPLSQRVRDRCGKAGFLRTAHKGFLLLPDAPVAADGQGADETGHQGHGDGTVDDHSSQSRRSGAGLNPEHAGPADNDHHEAHNCERHLAEGPARRSCRHCHDRPPLLLIEKANLPERCTRRTLRLLLRPPDGKGVGPPQRPSLS